MRASLLMLAITVAFAQRERIEQFELRPAADGLRLYITIEGENRLISNRATKAWNGWTPQMIIYSERTTPDAKTHRLRWYDSLSRESVTISDGEEMEYIDVVPVRLLGGDYVLLISLRDQQSKAPWSELASPRGGVFLREEFASWGTAANDRAQLRRYIPEEVERQKGDLSLLAPNVVASIPLVPLKKLDAAGMYEYAAEGITATLNLRPGGQGTLVVQKDGKSPVASQSAWTQTGNEVRFGGWSWVAGVNGLTPKIWDRAQWGAEGLPLRRATGAAPLPGTPKR